MKIPVKRKDLRIPADMTRVIARFFFKDEEQARLLLQQLLGMDEATVQLTLNQVLRNFAHRHRKVTKVFQRHFQRISHLIPTEKIDLLTEPHRLLIGSYFTHEYSIESAAFFNPSLVVAPDQSGLAEGELRLIASMRATGEGHISSIVFRHLTIDYNNDLHLAPTADRLEEAEVIQDHIYRREPFLNNLQEMRLPTQVAELVTDLLPEKFNYRELKEAIQTTWEQHREMVRDNPGLEEILWLAEAHHELRFSLDTDISERVIFPHSTWESKGIEDARFVRFQADDGEITYYATYTAYDGFAILPKLIATKDFIDFKIKPLYGKGAQNKNLALFPRKVNGKYAMLARIDGMNNYIMFSDRLSVWEDPILLQTPLYPWELVQIGNCGSPIETEAGWLLITHGVGPMRRYCLGATLLDLQDPSKVIGRLEEPLLFPNEEEREGYVPNVVYSCGSIIHQGELIVPYAMSDYASTFMTVPLDLLLERLVAAG